MSRQGAGVRGSVPESGASDVLVQLLVRGEGPGEGVWQTWHFGERVEPRTQFAH